MPVLIVSDHAPFYLTLRTRQRLPPGTEVLETLPEIDFPLWILRAGTWPIAETLPDFPESATGKPTVLLGAIRGVPAWESLLAETGGILENRPGTLTAEVFYRSVFVDRPCAAKLRDLWRDGRTFPEAMDSLVQQGVRLLHSPALDVGFDPRMRILQVISSLQRGGAERLSLDLHTAHRKAGFTSLLLTTGKPGREAFAAPPGWFDMSGLRRTPEVWDGPFQNFLRRYSPDLIHAHLLGPEILRFFSRYLPVLLTIHNSRSGWTDGTETLTMQQVKLLVGCSRQVQKDLLKSGIPVPIRSIFNGIDPAPFARTQKLRDEAREVRRNLGWSEEDPVILNVGNPRPQKQQELLPALLKEIQVRWEATGRPGKVRLIIAGEASTQADAQESLRKLNQAIESEEVAECVLLPGAVKNIPLLLACSDIFISLSAHEGLSLAQMEALAGGLPVLTSAVGGSEELSRDNPACRTVAPESSLREIAELAVRLLRDRPEGGSDFILRNFHCSKMAQRYRTIYRSVIFENKNRSGLWLIVNNFSTGGAQSSARRLLMALKEQGIAVRAAVVQELPDNPTPGRQALNRAGIAVHCPQGRDVPEVTDTLTEMILGDPPEVVVFWNLIAEYKVRLVDALPGIRIFDVSPGEMYFESMAAFFGKPPPADLPYRHAEEYGKLLSGLIVKYAREAPNAADFGCTIHVIPNGVQLPESRLRNAPGEVLTLGTACRIHPHKCLEEILDAVRLVSQELPPFRVRIAGGPDAGREEYAESLKESAQDLPIDWLGEVQDIPGFLSGLDLFIMLGEPAGCPNASLEAMAAGLGILATDGGGMSEQVIDGLNGLLVPRHDVLALAEAIRQVVQNPGLCREWGETSRQRAEEVFSMAKMVQAYRQVFGI